MAAGTKIGDLFFDVTADTTKALASIGKVGGQLGGSLTKSLGSAIGKTVGVITAPLVAGFEAAAAGGAAIFGAVLTTGFSRLVAIDSAEGKLRALGHTTEDVANIMDSALQAVIGTQYNLGEAATVAASAVAAGIKPGAELTKYLQLIADTATVSGLSLEQVGSIINKTTAFQRVYLRELNQLANKGIPIFTWLQEEYGVTGEQLRKMVHDGEIDAATFQRVIQEHIGGAALEFGLTTFQGGLKNTFAAMGRLGETLLGPFFDSLRDTVFPTAIKIFDELNERLKPVMTTFSESKGFKDFLDNFADLTSKVGPFIDMLGKFGPLIAPVTALLGATGLGQLKNLLGPFGAFLPKINPILAIFVGLATVSKPLRDGIKDVIDAFGDLFSSVDSGGAATGLNSLVKLIGEGLGGALSYAAGWIRKLEGPLSSIGPFISEVVRSFRGIDEIGANTKGGGFAANLKKDIAGVSEVATKIGLVLRDVVNAVVDAWPTIQDIIVSALQTIGHYIEWFIDNVVPLLVKAFQAVVEWIKKNWPAIRDTIVSVISSIVEWVRTNWPQIRDTVIEVVTQIQAAIQWFVDNILPHLIDGFQRVVAFVQEVWPQVQETITTVLTAIGVAISVAATVISFIWDNFGKTILMAVETVWDYITKHIQAALDVINGILNIFIGVFTGDWGRAWDGIKQFVYGIWEEIKAIVQLAIDSVRVIISLALDNLQSAWNIAWAAIKAVVEPILAAIGVAVGGLRDGLQTLWDKASDVAGFLTEGFATAFGVAEGVVIALKNALLGVWDWLQSLWDKAADVGSFLSGTFKGALDGITDALGFVGDAIGTVAGFFQKVIDKATAAAAPILAVVDALKSVTSWLSGDISTKYGAGDLSKFGKPHAAGGPVFSGMTYPVGENGWELFTPKTNGTIIPHDISSALVAGMAMASTSSSNGQMPSISVSIDARGATENAAAAIGQATEQGVLAALAQYTKARG